MFPLSRLCNLAGWFKAVVCLMKTGLVNQGVVGSQILANDNSFGYSTNWREIMTNVMIEI